MPRLLYVKHFLRWLWPCVVATLLALVVAGAVEAIVAGLPLRTALATAGFALLITAPFVFGATVLARLVQHAWAPWLRAQRTRAPGYRNLTAWALVAIAALTTLGQIQLQATWWLFRSTKFTPRIVAVGQTGIMLAALVLVVALAPLAWRWLDNSLAWLEQHRFRFTARTMATLVALALLGGAAATARTAQIHLLGHLDTGLLLYPAASLIALGVAAVLWPRLGNKARLVGSFGLAGLTVTAVAMAVFGMRYRPADTLAIWAQSPLAGYAIDRHFDIERARQHWSTAQFQPVARPGATHPDIFLITIDTIRADRTSPYGGPARTPTLQQLAAEGTVFEWAFAPSNVTRRSMPSMFIGISAPRVRGRVVGWSLKLDPRHVTVAERLREAGYTTAAFVCCDGFWGSRFKTGWDRGISHLFVDRDGEKLVDAAIAWWQARPVAPARPPAFVWLHFLEPHNWNIGDAANGNDRAAYDRVLEKVDTALGRLVAKVASIGAPAATPATASATATPALTPGGPVWIITGDHGEALAEHGTTFHSTDLYNSQLRVPLIISGAGVAGQRVADVASGTDLVPTILELAGYVAPTGADMDGRSLWPYVQGERPASRLGGYAYAAMIRDRSNPGGQRAVVANQWKLYQRESKFELYNLVADPNEHNNLIASQATVFAQLKALLDAAGKRDTEPPFLTVP